MKRSKRCKDPLRQIRFRNILLVRAPEEWNIENLLTDIAEIKNDFVKNVNLRELNYPSIGVRDKNQIRDTISFGFIDVVKSNPVCTGKDVATALVNSLLQRNDERDTKVVLAVIFYTGPKDTQDALIERTQNIQDSCFYVPKCTVPQDIWKSINVIITSIAADPNSFHSTIPLAIGASALHRHIKETLKGYNI